jgi:hypothetical protein
LSVPHVAHTRASAEPHCPQKRCATSFDCPQAGHTAVSVNSISYQRGGVTPRGPWPPARPAITSVARGTLLRTPRPIAYDGM